jgi:hypothetical protein
MQFAGSLVGCVTDVASVLWGRTGTHGRMFDRSGVGSAKRTKAGAMAQAGQLAKVGAD